MVVSYLTCVARDKNCRVPFENYFVGYADDGENPRSRGVHVGFLPALRAKMVVLYEDARIMGECAGFSVGSGLPHLFYRGNFPYFRASNFLFHVSSSESRHCHSWSDSFLA